MENTFKELDLRKQLTEELKSKWYYQESKWGLRINKHSVVFDDCFKWEVKYLPRIVRYAEEDYDFEYEGEKFHVTKGEDLSSEDCIYVQEKGSNEIFMICDNSKYSDSVEDILKNILLYIANRI